MPAVKVFVSGCYNPLHAGHVQFFREAKALGVYLVVSFASEKGRERGEGVAGVVL